MIRDVAGVRQDRPDDGDNQTGGGKGEHSCVDDSMCAVFFNFVLICSPGYVK